MISNFISFLLKLAILMWIRSISNWSLKVDKSTIGLSGKSWSRCTTRPESVMCSPNMWLRRTVLPHPQQLVVIDLFWEPFDTYFYLGGNICCDAGRHHYRPQFVELLAIMWPNFFLFFMMIIYAFASLSEFAIIRLIKSFLSFCLKTMI